MEKLIVSLLKEAKKSKKSLGELRTLARHLQMNEFADKLRELESKLFPESKEYKEAHERAKKLNLLFRMVELNIPESVCWTVSETLKVYNRKKGNFDLLDATKLIDKKNELFPEK
jgi:hypothetical protein